jgi:tyrosyl-tRNA synthetase
MRVEPAAVEVKAGARSIAQLFVDARLASSKSEARRLAGQKGITVNGQLVTSVDDVITPADGMVLQRGSHRVVRLKVS